MNAWITRGLHTAVLTGGFLAVGAGIASADQNDVVADVAGLTVTVPVDDSAVLDTPVVTGGGENLTVTGDPSAGGVSLPVDTSSGGSTTVDLDGPTGDAGGIDAVSVPVTVSEAQAGPPDPDDGLTVTVPVNTSDGDEDAGTTVLAPVVTGNLGSVLDDDPTSGSHVAVDLDGLLVVRDADDGSGSRVHLDVEDLVTIGGTGGNTSPETVLAAPVSAEDGADTTVSLANGDGPASPGTPGTGAGGSGTGTGGTSGTGGSHPAGRTVLAATGRAFATLPGSVEGAAPGALASTGAAALVRVLLFGMLTTAAGLLLLLLAAGRRRRPVVA